MRGIVGFFGFNKLEEQQILPSGIPNAVYWLDWTDSNTQTIDTNIEPTISQISNKITGATFASQSVKSRQSRVVTSNPNYAITAATVSFSGQSSETGMLATYNDTAEYTYWAIYRYHDGGSSDGISIFPDIQDTGGTWIGTNRHHQFRFSSSSVSPTASILTITFNTGGRADVISADITSTFDGKSHLALFRCRASGGTLFNENFIDSNIIKSSSSMVGTGQTSTNGLHGIMAKWHNNTTNNFNLGFYEQGCYSRALSNDELQLLVDYWTDKYKDNGI